MKKNIYQNLTNNRGFYILYSIIFLLLCVLYLLITYEKENTKLKYIKDKNYFPKVEIKTS
jgi:Ca2+/Na+ antiporter